MTYEDNLTEVVLDIQKRLTKASDVSKLQRTVATYLLSSNWDRITKGGSVSGRQIGSYNTTKPLYVNPRRAVRAFPVKGKTGKTKFNNGLPHKTAYFTSYSAFRSAVGRNIAVVNLQLSGKLRRDWAIEQTGKDWVVGFLSEYGSNVSRGNEAKFNCQIFGVSQKDKEQIKIIEDDFIKTALNAKAQRNS